MIIGKQLGQQHIRHTMGLQCSEFFLTIFQLVHTLGWMYSCTYIDSISCDQYDAHHSGGILSRSICHLLYNRNDLQK